MMQKKNWAKKRNKKPLKYSFFYSCFDLSQCTVMQCFHAMWSPFNQPNFRNLTKGAGGEGRPAEKCRHWGFEREREGEKKVAGEEWPSERFQIQVRERVVFVQIQKYICDHFKLNFSLSRNLLERYCGGLSGTQHKTGQRVLFQSSFFSKGYYAHLQSAEARNQCGIMWKSTSFVQIRGGKNNILLCLICLPDSSDPSQMTKFIKEVKTCSGRPKKIILERKASWKRKGKDLRRNIRRVLRLAKGTLIHKVGWFSCLWIFLLMF